MKAFLKYSVLLFVVIIYLIQQIDSSTRVVTTDKQEKIVSNEEEAFHQLAFLTALNANAVPVNSVHEVLTSFPTCRYLPKSNLFCGIIEERKCVFPSYFKNVEHFYRDSFALKQDAGYYVFALREIIV
ncbi:hypothetical protein [Gabonibacter chumensis]|uniref:hypothetical protein n=1 Tax=Gabonibacter chumensis TaxID=2972474 RepID=UPI002572DD07|nr:hypothetical protein [Gabonibacter chumensis]MCR9013325.1 hypothetical protein [Gabonibacter chumensis]